MLQQSTLVKTTSVNRLLQLWAHRYVPDLTIFETQENSLFLPNLFECASPEGRTATAAKLEDHLIQIKCQMASLQAQSLYAYIPNILDLSEAQRLAHYAFLVYQQLSAIYGEVYSPLTRSIQSISLPLDKSQGDSMLSWAIPPIAELAKTLEPVLLEFQEQHIATKNWRTLGFLTTLLNFGNELIFAKLTQTQSTRRRLSLCEQVLLLPYFKFIEEQVAIPWERVCAAAASHSLTSPAFILVEQMFPQSRDIAQAVYRKLMTLLPHHRSRRGGLDHSGITHSCLRDLEMFQAYLWLCVLEGNMVAIDKELVGLCVLVMTGVNVKWEMVERWNNVLVEEILDRVTPEQRRLLKPYTQGLKKVFWDCRDRFQGAPDAEDMSRLPKIT
ncbi:hypothetical protein [Coleofasciculus chthonoplastes]|uniref:hypothetical protein n=1 Tax=Coleofasciculus chthonoplastes TaxID=64178 RepID=UPI0032F9C195